MRINLFLSALLFIFINSSVMKAQNLPPSQGVNFLSEAEGTISLRVIGIGHDAETVLSNAEMQVFQALLFRGIPKSTINAPLLGTEEDQIRMQYKEYFEQLFTKKQYKRYILSVVQTSDIVKHKKGQQSASMDFTINYKTLKQNLEDSGLVRKWGY